MPTEDPRVEQRAENVIGRLRARLGLVHLSHTAVDTYSAFVPPIVLLLEVRCELTRSQTAIIVGLGSLTSGLTQPIAAWLSDRFDSRVFAPLGLVLAAVCLSCIGVPRDFVSLVVLYTFGMIGVGMYHPVGASSAGQLSEMIRPDRRSMGLSYFFVAGMAGGIIGSLAAPAIAGRENGFSHLQFMLIPGLLIALLLLPAIRKVPHRDHKHSAAMIADSIAARWRMVAVLYVSNALRFTVNIALVYLFVRWAQAHVQRSNPALVERAVAEAAGPMVGHLNALVMVGMAIGGLSAGSLVRAGREKIPMVLIPLVGAPLIALLPLTGIGLGYVLTALIGFSFAATNPLSISLSQRLLPHRTSLASSLMMGAAWSVAMVGPLLVEFVLEQGWGLNAAFVIVAGLLGLSGLLNLLLDQKLLQQTALRRTS